MKVSRIAPLIVVVAAIIALVGVGQVAQPSLKVRAAVTRADVVGVDGTTLVCAQSPHQDSQTSTRTVIGSGTPGTGAVSIEPIDRSSPTLPLPLNAAAPVGLVGTLTEKPLVVRATGQLASGLVGLRTTVSGEAQIRGLETDRCVVPRTQFWFAGVSTLAASSTTVGVKSLLHLSNAEDSPASVTLTAVTGNGVVTTPNTAGLILAPHSVYPDIDLSLLAPNIDQMAVQVLATRGRVAASITDSRVPTTAPQGIDVVPSQGFPAPSVVIPAVPGSPDGSPAVPPSDSDPAGSPGTPPTTLAGSTNVQTLLVAVPGSADATVHVEITDDSGRFLAVGADSFTVGAGTEQAVELTNALSGSAVVLHVYSDRYVPIVAGLSLASKPKAGDYREILHVGPSQPVSGPAVLGDLRYVRGDAPTDSEIVLTSYSRRDVDITITPQGGGPKPFVVPHNKVLIIKASQLHAADASPFSAVIMPEKGATNLYAGVILEELGFNGPLIGGYSVSGGVGSVVRPPASADVTLPLIDARGQ